MQSLGAIHLALFAILGYGLFGKRFWALTAGAAPSESAESSAAAFGRTYVIPVSPDKLFPPIPRGGFHSEDEIARLPGVRVIEAADVFPGPTPETYAYSRQTVQRNLYRVPLP